MLRCGFLDLGLQDLLVRFPEDTDNSGTLTLEDQMHIKPWKLSEV